RFRRGWQIHRHDSGSTGPARHVLRRQGQEDALRDRLLRHVGHAERAQPDHRHPDNRAGLYRSVKIDLTATATLNALVSGELRWQAFVCFLFQLESLPPEPTTRLPAALAP